jgi:hypothetical protein
MVPAARRIARGFRRPGWLGSFWSGMDKGRFVLMIAAIAALAGATI